MFRLSSCPSSGAQLESQPLIYRWNVVVVILLVVVGPLDGPRPTARLPPHSNGKSEAATPVELLMMGMKMSETRWAVFKRQGINLRNCCIWLVDSFEYMILHVLTNTKFITNHLCIKSTIKKSNSKNLYLCQNNTLLWNVGNSLRWLRATVPSEVSPYVLW
jgi:hypothetical protein